MCLVSPSDLMLFTGTDSKVILWSVGAMLACHMVASNYSHMFNG